MSERAECVMLNKGPHIQKAVIALDSILSRMQAHQSKKTAMLRQLRSWNHPPWTRPSAVRAQAQNVRGPVG
jgi:pyruvate kinase